MYLRWRLTSEGINHLTDSIQSYDQTTVTTCIWGDDWPLREIKPLTDSIHILQISAVLPGWVKLKAVTNTQQCAHLVGIKCAGHRGRRVHQDQLACSKLSLFWHWCKNCSMQVTYPLHQQNYFLMLFCSSVSNITECCKMELNIPKYDIADIIMTDLCLPSALFSQILRNILTVCIQIWICLFLCSWKMGEWGRVWECVTSHRTCEFIWIY